MNDGEIRKQSVVVPDQKPSRGSLPKAIKFECLYILKYLYAVLIMHY